MTVSVSGDSRIGSAYLEREQKNSSVLKRRDDEKTQGHVEQSQKIQKTIVFVAIGIPKEEEKEWD